MGTSTISVLIVERHPLMREALQAAIDEAPDLTVAGETAHVTEALLVAASLAPDVFLISLDEPVPEAVAAMGVLRRAQPAARILALTSEEVTGRERDILNTVAHTVLTKATPRAELVHAIRGIAAIRSIAAVRRTATIR
jgi:DNA-binding NarL/FixJ family response regulator